MKKRFHLSSLSIKGKVVGLLVSLIILAVGATGTLLYLKIGTLIQSQSESDMLNQTKGYAELVSGLAQQNWLKLGIVASSAPVSQIVNLDETNSSSYKNVQGSADRELKTFVEQNKGEIEHAFIVNSKGIIVAESNPALLGKNIADQSYVKETLTTGKPLASDTLASYSSGSPSVVFTQPIVQGGKTLGFIASSLKTSSFSTYFGNVKVTNSPSAYLYMVDSKSVRLYQEEDPSLVMKPITTVQIKQAVANANAGKVMQGTMNLFFGTERTVTYSAVPGTHWLVVITADKAEFTRPLRTLIYDILSIGLIFVLIASLIGFIFAQRITAPLKLLTSLIHRTSKFDLTSSQSDYEKLRQREDEIGSMAQAMLEMRMVLIGLAKRLIDSTSEIKNGAIKLDGVADEVSGHATDSSATTQQLSAGMEESAAASEEVAASAEVMKQNAEAISLGAKNGQQISAAISERAVSLKEKTLKAQKETHIFYGEVKERLKSALEQADKVNEINQLAESILQIAEQTNLLSLNAAIEAARAGEAGRGFSVVSDEVRKLAEQSSQTVGNIQRMVGHINSSMKNISDNAEELLRFVDENISQDYESFVLVSEQYAGDAQTITSLMTDFNKNSDDLLHEISSISLAIDHVTNAVNEEATGVQDIAAKSTAIVGQADLVKQTSDENLKSVETLQEIMAQFKVE